MRAFHTREPASGDRIHARPRAWWEADSTLLTQLEVIIADAATTGCAAQLIVARAGGLHVLVNVPAHDAPAHELAAHVFDREEIIITALAGGAPVRGPDGLHGAILVYGDAMRSLHVDTHILQAHAARVETALVAAAARRETVLGAVDALWQMLAAHDRETARHAQVVSTLACAVGDALLLGPADLSELASAALLHDIGKIAVPLHVLRKAEPLTGDEWALMRQHVALGERIIRAVPELDRVGLYVRHHHERWDGAGYPDRLAGAASPLAARIVGLADAYETMRTGRPYQCPRSCAEALDEVRRGAGTQFDPLFLDVLPILAGQEFGPRVPGQNAGYT